ncbi:tocopherol cyclase family protein [Sinanaerobacter chloroacetimidivorans]|uniref:Tocopherol cyclase n=1 Tax=Sinanaerobacter chloroacetimidivorans TaxID=2818044 RepID=A0A8J7VX54_9FIRM|nr:tocopherol cyclase family protein [Sinanaerobacter chloroacetimidivorans]MBR0596687.1 hypothetical protein [Sinanaerobacter chloroacetimidivorans]
MIRGKERILLLNKITNPILFQGSNTVDEYFEGWYYKQVSQDEKTVVCFIPGISLVVNDSHSFVQYIYVGSDENDVKFVKTGYCKYPVEYFSYNDHPFMIRVANNIFTETEISVQLTDHNINIEGTFKLDPFTSIHKSIFMPNIMGFFAYIPNMECYHGVISMNHKVHGNLKIDNLDIDFNNSKGYIEKDWGTSFPKKYIWVQSNHFKNTNTSIVCSAADIPFMKRNFFGFICNLVIDKKEYRFASYNRSKLQLECVTKQMVALSLKNSKVTLRLEAKMDNIGELISPKKGKMQETIKEGPSGELKISLLNNKDGILYEDISYIASIEIFGFDV